MYGSGAEAERLSRFENPSPGRQLLLDALDNIRAHRTTAKPLALAPRTRETGFYPLDNHGALELGKDAQHLEHCLSGWRAGVETLLVKVEIDAFGVQFAE